MTRHIHFTEAELAGRRARACAELRARGLAALVMFRQESMYYLTGYDTFGYVFFQTIVLTADGRMVLLTRSADQRQAAFTSVVEDIRIWKDAEGADPARELKAILAELGLAGARLGVEYDAYGLTARNGQRLAAVLAGFATLEDASDLVTRLRLVKSDAELAYVRRAAELADDAWDAALALAAPGAFEGDILAAMHGAIFAGGGDDPANEFIIGSGQGPRSGALMCRYFSGRRHLEAGDSLTLEFAGAFRHYHSCLFRTVQLGKPPQRQRDLYAAARDALAACEAALKPGATMGEVFAAHARTLDRAGFGAFRLNACGYGLGTTYAPNWMDWPMFYEGNPVVIAPGQVFFLHMILFDDAAGLPGSVGRTSIVTATGADPLSKIDLALTVV